MSKTHPRTTPDRDSKYMGLAWFHAGFSKDPSTQVGAQLVSDANYPLGSGYNGPPRRIKDKDVIWERPTKDAPNALSKYDLIVHAEINAMEFSSGYNLADSTMYVTAMPCPHCMLDIVRNQIKRVVYYDFKSHKGSILQSDGYKEKTIEIARLGGVKLEEFDGNVGWVMDWALHLKQLGIFEI